MLITLFIISAVLFGLVTWFSYSQGMFDEGLMGVGLIFAIGLYLLVWVGGTILATLAAILTHA